MRVIIEKAFEGYPDGKTPTHYAPGAESIEVPDDFGTNIVSKGLARPADGSAAAVAAPVAAAAHDEEQVTHEAQ